ncbi:MAG: fumarylacetoacetate hydrolase family protein [Planctomycetes bacterium]|nr:fumarylacetoacetate hydrolase family protein [Planctomycetota bacterium]MBI3843606.1 fumarylacetoacetate hydrolase family protein [Planctomycetota bacterium]
MKLIRFGPERREMPGVILTDGARLDCRDFGEDWNEAFFGNDGLRRLRAWLTQHSADAPRIDRAERLGAPVARPSKIVCIGLNYSDHAKETKAEIPKEPVIFFKATTALVGPADDLVMPRGGTKVDWEVELAVVIGHEARYVQRQNAMEHVAGFALHNDYSERAFQIERGGQWVKGKSCDTFAPLGPWVATVDEVPDFQSLGMWLTVNGESRQKSSTSNMIFDVPTLVSYVSQFMTLLPGDVISTGTPAGVGLGMNPPVYLRESDVVECGIDKLGRQRQKFVRK